MAMASFLSPSSMQTHTIGVRGETSYLLKGMNDRKDQYNLGVYEGRLTECPSGVSQTVPGLEAMKTHCL